MPRYHFNVYDGRFIPDEVGTELPDIVAARSAAVIATGEAIRDLGGKFWDNSDWRMDVADKQGKVLFTLRLSGSGPVSARDVP